jgi:hypothetical protein
LKIFPYWEDINGRTDPKQHETLRQALRSPNIKNVRGSLRALRIVAVPELAEELCSRLEASVENTPLTYDVLYALSLPENGRAALPILSANPGVERLVQLLLEVVRNSNENAARNLSAVLRQYDPEKVEAAMIVARKDTSLITAETRLRKYLSDFLRADESDSIARFASQSGFERTYARFTPDTASFRVRSPELSGTNFWVRTMRREITACPCCYWR